MENANLPTQLAREPTEAARQINGVMLPPTGEAHAKKQIITFADDVENTYSQTSSNYKEVLSQPAPGLTHRQKLLWLQKRRSVGIWAQCEDCEKWRYLPNILDSSELPNKWYCRMNRDKSFTDCSIPETPLHIRDEEDLIHSDYSAGSLVWARLNGWPWWPAMVDDCPDVEQFYWLDGFSDIPTHYNVVFFDSHDVTRAWIASDQMRPYNTDKSILKMRMKKYTHRLEAAITQANDAVRLSLLDRLAKYSFVARYKGNITSPKRVSKKELVKYQKVLKRKFNVDFPIESSDSDDNEPISAPQTKKTDANNEKSNKIAKNVNNDIANITVKRSNNKYLKKDKKNKTAESKRYTNEPDSTAVQVGSNVNSSLTTTTIDQDDTTYIPETHSTMASLRDLREMVVSPASDDFDFL